MTTQTDSTARPARRQASFIYTPKSDSGRTLTLFIEERDAEHQLHGTLEAAGKTIPVVARLPRNPGPRGPFFSVSGEINGKNVTGIATLNALNMRQGKPIDAGAAAGVRMNFTARGAMLIFDLDDAREAPTIWAYLDPKGLPAGQSLPETMSEMGYVQSVIDNFMTRQSSKSATAA
jgi:hypothetical protein